MQRAAAKQEAAQEEVVLRVMSRATAVCRSILGAREEHTDATQAALEAVLRRAGVAQSDVILRCEDLELDDDAHRVTRAGVEIALTPTEFRLLNVLMQEAGRVVSHQQLLRQVWGPTHAREIQYLRVYMKQLREKIEREPARPEFLVTSPGVGYRLKVTD